MAKNNLVVVESAAKAKTIEKFLGRGYTVRASLGHVRDLPTSQLGVNVEDNFTPQYVVPKERKETVKKLIEEAKGAPRVLLATDPDREGEAIAWHLASALGLEMGISNRIEFHEITKTAIDAAMKSPRAIDMQRVDAQQARRVLDRLIGYPVSNFLGRKVRRGLSAGRVQSVAVRMIVERQSEIDAFVPVEYWSLDAELAKHDAATARFVAGLTQRDGKKVELHTGVDAETVQSDLDKAAWAVAEVKEREQQRHPAAPFTTSTLQQEASRKLSFTARRTMSVAQQLYEGMPVDGGEAVGLITYMRTDSVTIADSARDEARDYIRQKLGEELLPKTARVYRTRSRLAQEAHEAIRPTSAFREPEAVRAFLTSEQFRLYDLIWKRFMASQMASAIFDVTSVDVNAQATGKPAYRFRATGSRLKFRGFLSVYLEGRDDEEIQDEDRQPLPELRAGDPLNLLGLKPLQHFTQPPPHYTEATLVKALEEHGIGRPSTYAPTLSTIVDRGYVDRDGRKLTPTELGVTVNTILVQQFGDIMNVDFTAAMEEQLDEVANGQRPWVPVVDDYYKPLKIDLDRADVEVEKVNSDIPTDEICSEGHPMVIKQGRFGKFLACTSYPEHKETRPLAEDLPPDAPEESCSHGIKMLLRTGRFGPFYTSTHECGETKPLALRVGVQCPTDGGDLVEKRSRRGKVFFGCNNWPNCDWVSWYRPLTEPCPEPDCGGLQLDLGRGRVRCLKHEGPMPVRESASKADGDGDGKKPARKAPVRKTAVSKAKTAAAAKPRAAAKTTAAATKAKPAAARAATAKPRATTKNVVKRKTPATRARAAAAAV